MHYRLLLHSLLTCALLAFMALPSAFAQKKTVEKSGSIFHEPEVEIPIIHAPKNHGMFSGLFELLYLMISESKALQTALAAQAERVSNEMNQRKAQYTPPATAKKEEEK